MLQRIDWQHGAAPAVSTTVPPPAYMHPPYAGVPLPVRRWGAAGVGRMGDT